MLNIGMRLGAAVLAMPIVAQAQMACPPVSGLQVVAPKQLRSGLGVAELNVTSGTGAWVIKHVTSFSDGSNEQNLASVLVVVMPHPGQRERDGQQLLRNLRKAEKIRWNVAVLDTGGPLSPWSEDFQKQSVTLTQGLKRSAGFDPWTLSAPAQFAWNQSINAAVASLIRQAGARIVIELAPYPKMNNANMFPGEEQLKTTTLLGVVPVFRIVQYATDLTNFMPLGDASTGPAFGPTANIPLLQQEQMISSSVQGNDSQAVLNDARRLLFSTQGGGDSTDSKGIVGQVLTTLPRLYRVEVSPSFSCDAAQLYPVHIGLTVDGKNGKLLAPTMLFPYLWVSSSRRTRKR